MSTWLTSFRLHLQWHLPGRKNSRDPAGHFNFFRQKCSGQISREVRKGAVRSGGRSCRRYDEGVCGGCGRRGPWREREQEHGMAWGQVISFSGPVRMSSREIDRPVFWNSGSVVSFDAVVSISPAAWKWSLSERHELSICFYFAIRPVAVKVDP